MESFADYRCGVCGFQVGEVIAHLPSGVLAHYSDREFPGRCVLAVHDHAERLEDLPPEQLEQLWRDATRAGLAIRGVTGARRINYAVLGNAVPHIHVHLIPRGAPSDRHGTDTPWGPPPVSLPVSSEDAERLRRDIALALE